MPAFPPVSSLNESLTQENHIAGRTKDMFIALILQVAWGAESVIRHIPANILFGKIFSTILSRLGDHLWLEWLKLLIVK
jgi:hypothetical protein